MNREKILTLMTSIEDDVKFAEEVSNAIVVEKTKELDDLMRYIQDNVVLVENPGSYFIEKALAELTNAVYFISSRVETFGFYEDISKANARLKYNEAYAANQLANTNNAKKPTQADNTLYAEMNSVDETMLNVIYARSMKIVKGKLENAGEMIRTLSKMLSVRMNQDQAARFTNKLD